MKSEGSKSENLSVDPELFSHLPFAFALMKVKKEEDAIQSVSYAYVNERFCKLSLREASEFLGKDIAEVHGEKAKETWLGYITEIKARKAPLKGVCYYAPAGSSLNYTISATQDPSYFTVIYTSAGIKEEEMRQLRSEKLLNEKILRLAQKISASALDEASFAVLLQAIGTSIGAQRVYFVKLGKNKEIFAQYKAKGNSLDPISPTSEIISGLFSIAEKTGEPLVLNERKSQAGDRTSLAFLKEGIKTHVAFPFLSEGRLIACLCADDYPIEKEEEAIKILQNACYFISYKWSNTLLLKKLRYQARRDQLTGLLNRYGYQEAIQNHFSSDPSSPCVFALIDIDDFKNINDLYGHQAGDSALQKLSSEIVSCFGEEAICGRYGGDEIAVLLPKTSLNEAKTILETFVASRHSFLSKASQVDLSFSIGYAAYPEHGRSFSALLSLADEACYAAKLSGKGCCYAYQRKFDSLDKTTLGFNFHSIADGLPIPFLLFGEEGEIYYANALCLSLLGHKNLLSLASEVTMGIYSLFQEKEELASFLKESDSTKNSVSLTLINGQRVEFVFPRKNDPLPSVHYALLLKK